MRSHIVAFNSLPGNRVRWFAAAQAVAPAASEGAASVGGRPVAPSGAELSEFLQTGELGGAIGASFWVWQSATSEEWAALATYRW
jgi:hypothetical protein